ncbi:MAG: adenylate kinase [Propionibacteriales bacterium]|nr:adenylate kinase [Propionibacteriales bacterium]
MRVVLVGAPGAGKGTQAKFIAEHYGIPPISTGDIFRANIAAKTELGREAKRYMDAGDLVPDKVTIGIVRDRLAQDDTEPGFLLDGFPRTVGQARALTAIVDDLGTPLDVVLELQVDDDEVVRRLSGRRTCRSCGHVWHLEFDPPSTDGICDECGGELFQRDDDRPETIRRRLEVYADQTEPLVGFYTDAGLLRAITAQGSVDEITQLAIEALELAVRA